MKCFSGFQLALHVEDSETITDYAELVLSNDETVDKFTICQWIKLKYLSASFNQVWQYCYNLEQDGSTVCTAFGWYLPYILKQ